MVTTVLTGNYSRESFWGLASRARLRCYGAVSSSMGFRLWGFSEISKTGRLEKIKTHRLKPALVGLALRFFAGARFCRFGCGSELPAARCGPAEFV